MLGVENVCYFVKNQLKSFVFSIFFNIRLRYTCAQTSGNLGTIYFHDILIQNIIASVWLFLKVRSLQMRPQQTYATFMYNLLAHHHVKLVSFVYNNISIMLCMYIIYDGSSQSNRATQCLILVYSIHSSRVSFLFIQNRI